MSEKAKKSEGVRFVHLHGHTDKSLRDASLKIEAMIKKLLNLKMNAVAVTEHGNMHSTMDFYKACMETAFTLIDEVGEKQNIIKDDLEAIKKLIPGKKSLKKAVKEVAKLQEYQKKYPELFAEVMEREIKPIIGIEAYIIPTKEMAKSDDDEIKHLKYHLVLLAKDITGYHQIVKAITKAQLLKDKKTYPRMTYEDLKEFFVGGHVIALSGCMQGEIANILLKGEYEEAKKKALFYQSIFGKGNFYIELQNHNIPEELEILPQLIKISRETGIPMVASNDFHYANKEDSKVRDMVVAMRFGQTVNDDDFQKDCGELYIKTQEEMFELFSEVPEAIENTIKIAEQCDIEFVTKKHFPVFQVPNGKTEAEYLTELTYKGIYRRFPDFDTNPKWTSKWKKLIYDRIEYELDVITSLHYDGYLLIVQDFLEEGRRRGLVGPGRGSAVGSLVCYLIGITNVNPLKYGLLFERFLNKDRVSDPDYKIAC
jgi:DNA polymerase-3 subunit alpha